MKLHYFRPKKQKKGLLYQGFIIVAIIQVALLIGFSGMVITQSIIKEETAQAGTDWFCGAEAGISRKLAECAESYAF